MTLADPSPGAAVTTHPRRLHRRFPGARVLGNGAVLYWWAEVAFIGIFYFVYSTVRNLNQGGTAAARHHAMQIIDLQGYLGINVEHSLQHWALGFEPLIIACNYFYGSLHFVVTAGVLIYLYHKWRDDYPLWRNALAIATGVALIGFVFYPLMPPRLLPAHFGFVDTLAKDPAFWSFNSGGMQNVSNQYAAMPSVHIAWAAWCALALGPRLKNRTAATFAWCYPLITLVVIVITANHFILDAVAGLVILGIGWVAANRLTRAGRAPHASERTESPGDQVA